MFYNAMYIYTYVDKVVDFKFRVIIHMHLVTYVFLISCMTPYSVMYVSQVYLSVFIPANLLYVPMSPNFHISP